MKKKIILAKERGVPGLITEIVIIERGQCGFSGGRGSLCLGWSWNAASFHVCTNKILTFTQEPWLEWMVCFEGGVRKYLEHLFSALT